MSENGLMGVCGVLEVVGIALTLFMVMDPLGNVPLFLTALKDVAPSRRHVVLIRELLISLLLMVAVLFAGIVGLSFAVK